MSIPQTSQHMNWLHWVIISSSLIDTVRSVPQIGQGMILIPPHPPKRHDNSLHTHTIYTMGIFPHRLKVGWFSIESHIENIPIDDQ